MGDDCVHYLTLPECHTIAAHPSAWSQLGKVAHAVVTTALM